MRLREMDGVVGRSGGISRTNSEVVSVLGIRIPIHMSYKKKRGTGGKVQQKRKQQ